MKESSATPPRVEVVQHDGRVRIRLLEEHVVGHDYTIELRNCLDMIIGQIPGAHIEIEMQNVVYVSSAVLGDLMTVHRKLQVSQGRLRLINPRPEVMQTLAVTRLNDVLDIVEDTD